MKEIVGTIAVVLTFVGYVPYIRDTLKGKTKPHVYTWFVWGLVTLAAFALQMSAHAGGGVRYLSGHNRMFVYRWAWAADSQKR